MASHMSNCSFNDAQDDYIPAPFISLETTLNQENSRGETSSVFEPESHFRKTFLCVTSPFDREKFPRDPFLPFKALQMFIFCI